MAFSISNLPTGWRAGRTGGRRVFVTDKGKQLSEEEAANYFQVGSFSGFGTEEQDKKDNLQVNRPTVTDISSSANISTDISGGADVSMMNGGSDGVGNPDPVSVNPLGSSSKDPYRDTFNSTTDRYAESNDYQSMGLQSETAAGVVTAPTATESGEVLEAGNIPKRPEEKEAAEAAAAAEAEAAEAAAAEAKAEAERVKQAELDAVTVAAAEQRAADAEKAAADALAELEKLKLDWKTEIEERADRRVQTYESALDMLGKGDFGSVIEDYQNRISGEGDIDGGRPEQPTAELIKIGSDGLPELTTSTVDVSWGSDRRNNTGWGYYGIDPLIPGINFIITQETAAAGEDYVRDNAQIDQMEEFIERMAAAESDDARQQIMNQEMAFLNEEIADAARLKSQVNAEKNIDLQADRNLEAQDAAQAFSQSEREAREKFTSQERRYNEYFTEAENKLGRDFTTEERLAIQVYQDTVRDEERDLNREDTASAQRFAEKQQEDTQQFAREQQEDTQGFSREMQDDTQSFQEQSRLASQEFSRSERTGSQLFASDQASTAYGRDVEDREDRQANETFQRIQAQQFNIQRDKIEFDRQSRLESVRLGIADATSEDGIARAVELANEARQLERSSAMLDVVERIAASGLGRQMADSGLLEQLSAEFGVDLSFLITGGLGTGGGGNAPVRVTA